MIPRRWLCASALLGLLLLGSWGAVSIAHPPADADPFAPLRRDRAMQSDSLVLKGVEVAPGERLDLDLQRFEVLDPDARLIAADADGQYEIARPDVALFRGSVRGEPGSMVFIAIGGRLGDPTQGFIQTHDALRVISTGGVDAGGRSGRTLITDASRLIGGDDTGGFCADDVLSTPDNGWWPEPGVASGEDPMPPPCRIARIAVDTDWEFTQLFQGDTQASAAYAVTLLGAVSELYRRDLNVRLSVPYLRVWADNSDPYGAGPLYAQFSAHWNAQMQGVDRNAAHLLSGRADQLFAGEASIASLCVKEAAYGVSTKIKGTFPYPLLTQSLGNWDVFVAAHELGHNFGSVHTHEYTPPIDGCGSGNCAGANLGTIMSYCHLCPGGVGNTRLEFHPRVIATILDYLDAAPCALESSGSTARDDDAHAVETLPVVIDVLLNDEAESCDAIGIESFDTVSDKGGAVEMVSAGSFGRQRLRFTSAPGVGTTDSFSYTVSGGARATVHVQIQPLRAPDLTGAIGPGIKALYFVLTTSPTQMPNYAAMTPYLAETVTQLNYASSNAPFAGSGRQNMVGAVFEGFIDVPSPGMYTIYLSSDDGSRLWLGPDLLIDNDGVHTLLEKSAVIGLSPGKHAVRVEFFEGTGAAGLIVAWQGPGLAKQFIPASKWFRSLPCPGDRNLDARVDVTDLNIVLSQWGSSVPPKSGGDETGDGQVNANDLNVVLSHWNATCP